MIRYLGFAIVLYIPHLAEEALTGMHDDILIKSAYALFAGLSPRHAAYLLFQLTLVSGFLMTFLFALGGRWRLAVTAGLAIGLLAEGHHLVRAASSGHYNSGLASSFLMPFLGLYILRQVSRSWRRAVPCR